jgi:hypothetical protein
MPRPATDPAQAFRRRTVDELTIEDERSFRHVALYADLKEVLRRAKYPFRVLPEGLEGRADRALLLNLTFWGADAGGDVLESDTLPADVVAHAAWHHLAAKALPHAGKPSVAALFLGEAIASAFDVYLVGRLLGHAPSSSFLETQVPAMAEATESAGLDEDGFESMLEAIASDPERAFADLRCYVGSLRMRRRRLGHSGARRLRRPSLRVTAPPLRAVELGALCTSLRRRRG